MKPPEAGAGFIVSIDPDIMDLIPAFLLNRSKDLQAMRQALAAGDFETVRGIARRLMPSLELTVPLDLDEKSGASWGDMEAAR